MTRKRNFLCTSLCTATLLLAATGAMAGKVNRTPNDSTINGQTYNSGTSTIGPQMNRCWGEQASNLAQLDTSGVDVAGGGMGLHSRDNNAPGDTFRDSPFGGTDTNRLGIGNGTAQVEGPHHTNPSDGGLGVHAINNGSTTTQGPVGGLGFSQLADPLTGELTTTFGGTAQPVDIHCSLETTVP